MISPLVPDALEDGAVRAPHLRFRHRCAADGDRVVPEEVAVALVHNAATTAVMMATPHDLQDFGLGFSLNEGLVSSAADVREVDVVASDGGIEVRMWLGAGHAAELSARRRRQAGPTGCGLCGVDSLAEAVRSLPKAPDGLRLTADQVYQALEALPAHQVLGAVTRGAHAAGWWSPSAGFLAVREDVGRHNALDKLAGALARRTAPPGPGAVVLTSRVSVEMVQKAAVMGAQAVIAVSAPTSLAISTAEQAGLTLIAVARSDGFEVFSGRHRLVSA